MLIADILALLGYFTFLVNASSTNKREGTGEPFFFQEKKKQKNRFGGLIRVVCFIWRKRIGEFDAGIGYGCNHVSSTIQ